MPAGDHEADRLLALHAGDLAGAIGHLERQLAVLQTRSQFLLTIGTLTLTITGFSGPLIARSGVVGRIGLAAGLMLVLAALVLLLISSLRIRWLTWFASDDARQAVRDAMAWRDAKARSFAIQLLVLMVGLACYVVAVVWYLLFGEPRV